MIYFFSFGFNARQFLLKNGLDGIDIDWEFPAWPVSFRNVIERKLFSYLLKQLSNALRVCNSKSYKIVIQFELNV